MTNVDTPDGPMIVDHDTVQVEQPTPAEESDPLGFSLFGTNALQMQAAARALNVPYDQPVKDAEDAVAKMVERQNEAIAKLTEGFDLELKNTMLASLQAMHTVEGARVALASLTRAVDEQTSRAVTELVVGQCETLNGYVSATVNMVCKLKGMDQERIAQAYTDFNAVMEWKRKIFHFVSSTVEQFMAQLQEAAQAAVDSGALRPSDIVEPANPQVH